MVVHLIYVLGRTSEQTATHDNLMYDLPGQNEGKLLSLIWDCSPNSTYENDEMSVMSS